MRKLLILAVCVLAGALVLSTASCSFGNSSTSPESPVSIYDPTLFVTYMDYDDQYSWAYDKDGQSVQCAMVSIMWGSFKAV